MKVPSKRNYPTGLRHQRAQQHNPCSSGGGSSIRAAESARHGLAGSYISLDLLLLREHLRHGLYAKQRKMILVI